MPARDRSHADGPEPPDARRPLLLALILTCAAGVPSTSAQTIYHPSSFSFEIGEGARGVASGDFDRDGHVDLAAVSSGSNSISVLLGGPDRAFTADVDIATGSNPYSLAIGDLDEDGDPDIVAVLRSANLVSVFIGNGDGTFAAPLDYGTGTDAVWVGLADLDNDDHIDVVSLGLLSSSLTVRLGNGDGTLGPRTDVSPGISPWAGAFGDLDGDGSLDLVIAHFSSQSISTRRGLGDGTFAAPTYYATGTSMVSVAIGDLDGDGDPDVCATHDTGPGRLSIFKGNGDGTLGAPAATPMPGSATCVALADVNEDMLLDVAVGLQAGVVSVLIGDGAGALLPPIDVGIATSPTQLLLVDIDGDGSLDIATANGSQGEPSTISLVFGFGDGSFLSQAIIDSGLDPPGDPRFGDMNGDGFVDLVVGTAGNLITCYLGDGDGSFTGRRFSDTVHDATNLRLVDMDRDGHLDAITAYPGGLSILRGLGDGTVGGEMEFVASSPVRGWEVGALDSDLFPDIAYGLFDEVSVYRNDGAGGLMAPTEFPAGSAAQGVVEVEIGDLNGDENPDLLVGRPSFRVMLGDGQGGFAFSHNVNLGVIPLSHALRDMNADGLLDLVAAYDAGEEGAVALGNGDGTFAASLFFPTGSGGSVLVGQFDSDTIPDVAVVKPSASVSMLLGVGDGTLLPTTDLGIGRQPRRFDVGDLNGDDIDDFAFSLTPVGITTLVSNNPPKALLDTLFASGAGDGVTITIGWRYSDPSRPFTPRVEKSQPGESSWSEVAVTIHEEGGTMIAEDASADSGSDNWYRVVASGPEAVILHSGVVRASPPVVGSGPTRLALNLAGPNPQVGSRLRVSFVLPSASPARLELVDVGGRLMSRLAVGPLGPGHHVVDLSPPRALRSGLYFVRLTQDSETRTRRVTILE